MGKVLVNGFAEQDYEPDYGSIIIFPPVDAANMSCSVCERIRLQFPDPKKERNISVPKI